MTLPVLPLVQGVVAAAAVVLVSGWIVALRGWRRRGVVNFMGVRLQVVAFAMMTCAMALAAAFVGYPVAGWPALVAAAFMLGWTVLLVAVAKSMRPGP
jgi:hypothetical protein